MPGRYAFAATHALVSSWRATISGVADARHSTCAADLAHTDAI
jgi:hypothetical protein